MECKFTVLSDEVFYECNLSLMAIYKFPREVFHCTKNGVWSFAALHRFHLGGVLESGPPLENFVAQNFFMLIIS